MTLTSEGRSDALGDWLREDLASAKFLALLRSDPGVEGLIATMDELPPIHGYARQRVWSFDWLLEDGAERAETLEKTFGPADGGRWEDVSHVAMVTTAVGTVGRLLGTAALGSTIVVAPGQELKVRVNVAAS